MMIGLSPSKNKIQKRLLIDRQINGQNKLYVEQRILVEMLTLSLSHIHTFIVKSICFFAPQKAACSHYHHQEKVTDRSITFYRLSISILLQLT
jgi:hypothetical protein